MRGRARGARRWPTAPVAVCALALGLATASPAQTDDRPQPATVTLSSAGVSIQLQAAAAWNLQRIAYAGVEVAGPTGAYGTLLCVPAAGGWIGGLHTEGGVERVRAATLTVDGREVEPTDGAAYEGAHAELTKSSQLDVVRLDTRLILDAGRIIQRVTLEPTEDVIVSVIYPFMFCVSPQATAWLALTEAGEELSGEFTGDTEPVWHDDWVWTAAYLPTQRTGLLLRHTGRAEGARTLTAWWDTKRHRKLYVRLASDEEPWREGRRLEAEVTVVCFSAPPEGWQEVARAAAAGLVAG